MDKKKYIYFIICFFMAFLLITICSKNSFLYSFNDWVDANAFFTVGKGWANGLIPYKDLFEQKGPFLYFIYCLGYIISNDSFFGVYVLELISFSFFLYYCFNIVKLFSDNKYAFLSILLTGCLITTSIPFVQGGSAEEFCLPFIAYSSYSFFRYSNYDKKVLIINGLCAGIISLIKFNLLGFWFVWIVLIFAKSIFNKKIKESFFSILFFIIGMLIPIVLMACYFLINGAFEDFFEAYISFNVGSYSSDVSFKQRLLNMFNNFYTQLNYSHEINNFTILSFIVTFFSYKCYNIWNKLFILFSYLFLALGIYIGGTFFMYYYLLNEFYILFFFIFVSYVIIKYFEKNKIINLLIYSLSLVFACCFCYKCLKYDENVTYMKMKKRDYVQYKVANILKNNKSDKLLNYDCLDNGFYTAANIVPRFKYFMKQNIDYNRYPNIMDSQNSIISNKKADYVIVRESLNEKGFYLNNKSLNENYKVIFEENQIFEGAEYNYILYEKR